MAQTGVSPATSEPSAASAAVGAAVPSGLLAIPPGQRKFYLLAILCIFQFGMLLGLVFLKGREPSSDNRSEPPDDDIGYSQPVAAPKSDISNNLARADAWMREGRLDLALSVYQPLASTATPPLREFLNYRVALCNEGLGLWEESLNAYRSLMIGSNRRVIAAAQLGQVRVELQRGQPSEAKQLSWSLLLHSGEPALQEGPLLVEARYLLGLALALEASPVERSGPFNESPVVYMPNEWPRENALDFVPSTNKPEMVDQIPSNEAVSIQLRGANGDAPTVRAAAEHLTVAQLITAIASKADLKLRWSALAKGEAEARTIPVCVDGLSLDEMFSALVDPLGLKVDLRGNQLELTAGQEVRPELIGVYRKGRAQRFLAAALKRYPNESLMPAAELELGNLAAGDGKLPDAIAAYERALQENRSPARLGAFYNLGLVYSRSGDGAAARKAFYRAADQAPGHELATLSYLRIGRSLLEEGKADLATRPLRRAVAVSAGPATRAPAGLTLAAAYLMANNPQAAHAALLDVREQVVQEPFRPVAAFLEAFARYRAHSNRTVADREATDLLAALIVMRRSDHFGSIGDLLVGRAYLALGMNDEVIAIYEKARDRARGTFATEMSFVLADLLITTSQRDRARELLIPVANANIRTWTARAQLRLSEIALDEKKPDECLAWCRRLQDGNEVEAPTVEKLMGRAYERKGDHRRAAQCFAGQRVPPEPR
jgi:tetratricopeptide (TPR) repeat protein